jgi:phage shock protein PspC (stress-responsive transcriptional regulator)
MKELLLIMCCALAVVIVGFYIIVWHFLPSDEKNRNIK